jgi:hypothetical protein
MNNPFFYGNPVPHDQFLGRGREVRRIAGRIGSGQSTAVVGEPRAGKTSLLAYLAAPETRSALYGESAANLTFSFVDVHTLGGRFDQAQFWVCALEPLASVIAHDEELKAIYKRCRGNRFGGFVLSQFFTRLSRSGRRLVLLLDEFDALLHHPILNNAEFFGSLRSVASRSQGLTLVVATRRTLAGLNVDAQPFSQGGSPYFNFFSEVTLGALAQKDTDALLDWARERFSADDRRLVAEVAGGHPYLAQAAASALWDANEDGDNAPETRHLEAVETFYNAVAYTLSETWHTWSRVTQQAFGSVAVAHLQALAAQGCCGEVNAPEAVFIPESLPSQDRIALWKTLTQCVNDDELKTLCFTLHENYDNLGGETLEGHIRELILRMERKGRLHILIAACQERYPHQQWPGVAVSHAAPTFAVLSIADLARNFGQELRALKQQGFIAEDAAIPGGWRVRPLVFLWWLTDAAGLLPTGAQPLIEAAAREGTGR